MMRYKIIKKPYRHNESITDYYYVMKEVKKWYYKKPKWKHVREHNYAGYGKVNFTNLTGAEDYIEKMIESDRTELAVEDVKIYDTREKIIDNLLEDE